MHQMIFRAIDAQGIVIILLERRMTSLETIPQIIEEFKLDKKIVRVTIDIAL